MKKIKRIFIVHREGLDKKWWHRLANVLIYGSVISIFILSCCIGFFNLDQNFGNTNWKTYSYTYSFEPNYSQAGGKELSCDFMKSYSGEYISQSCWILGGDAKTLLTRYTKASGTYDQFIQKISQSGESYDQLLSESLKDGSFPVQLRAKRQPVVLYNVLIEDIMIGLIGTLLIILLWFVFWESIVYRLIVYIILGKK